MIQFSWEQSLCEEAAWFTYPEGKGCLVGLWLEWEWWLMGISVITETKFCFSTFQRSLASTSVFGGIPMSSQLAITGVGTPFVARFNRTTAVLYPERGPAHTCNGCIQSVVSLCKKRVKKIFASKKCTTSRSPSIRTFFAWTPRGSVHTLRADKNVKNMKILENIRYLFDKSNEQTVLS